MRPAAPRKPVARDVAAWATMHALLNEPLTAGSGQATSSILEFN
ncbi:hypothetical protein ACS19Z_05445 [Klebsiella pneumoniae]